MEAKVIKVFSDKEEGLKKRNVGDIIQVTDERFEEINSTNRGIFVERIDKEFNEEITYPYPKHTGGGWYEISNGEKVQGEENAMELERGLRGW